MSQPNFTVSDESPNKTVALDRDGHSPMGPPSLSGRRELEPIYQSIEVPRGKGLIIGVAACGAALLLFGLGMMMRGASATTAVPTPQTAPVEDFFSERQKIMREAVDMAREAQKMQRERMQMMRADAGCPGGTHDAWRAAARTMTLRAAEPNQRS